MVESAITVIVAAIIYALVHYYAARVGENPERFYPRKFVRAVLIGLIVGVAVLQSGVELKLTNFEAIATGIGAAGMADQLVKIIWRRFGLDQYVPRRISA